MPKMKINDISIYYEMHGQGEPIVFIAGFSADHLVWNEVVNILKANYQIIVLDNRGAGQTDAPVGPYSIDQMTSDIAALCNAIGIKKAHFVGNSMGGCILQTLAYKHPSLVKTAIISNSTTNTQSPFRIYLDALLQFRKSNTSLATLIKASCSWVFSYRFLSQPGVLDQLIQQSLDTPYLFSIIGFEGQYAALIGFESSSWVGKIKTPVMVVGSDQDLVFNEQSVRALADKIPRAQYYCFNECGHLPFVEHPEQFSNLIRAFIEQG